MTKIIEIPLTRGKVAIIDAADYELVSKYKWYANKKGRKSQKFYAANKGHGNRTVYLHRLILGDACTGLIVDHKNGNTLDNRRENLRAATHIQNTLNRRKSNSKASSKYKGVSWNQEKKKWSAEVRVRIGHFDNEDDAARAYNVYAELLHGQYACLNPIGDNVVQNQLPTPLQRHLVQTDSSQ